MIHVFDPEVNTNFDPAAKQEIAAGAALLKLINRAQCPSCRQWFTEPTVFWFFVSESGDVHTYALCPSCDTLDKSGERGRKLVERRIARFIATGGAQ